MNKDETTKEIIYMIKCLSDGLKKNTKWPTLRGNECREAEELFIEAKAHIQNREFKETILPLANACRYWGRLDGIGYGVWYCLSKIIFDSIPRKEYANEDLYLFENGNDWMSEQEKKIYDFLIEKISKNFSPQDKEMLCKILQVAEKHTDATALEHKEIKDGFDKQRKQNKTQPTISQDQAADCIRRGAKQAGVKRYSKCSSRSIQQWENGDVATPAWYPGRNCELATFSVKVRDGLSQLKMNQVHKAEINQAKRSPVRIKDDRHLGRITNPKSGCKRVHHVNDDSEEDSE